MPCAHTHATHPPTHPQLQPTRHPPAHTHAAQGTSPIYNLLPDILSSLSKEAGLPKHQFQAIMQQVGGRSEVQQGVVGRPARGQARVQAGQQESLARASAGWLRRPAPHSAGSHPHTLPPHTNPTPTVPTPPAAAGLHQEGQAGRQPGGQAVPALCRQPRPRAVALHRLLPHPGAQRSAAAASRLLGRSNAALLLAMPPAGFARAAASVCPTARFLTPPSPLTRSHSPHPLPLPESAPPHPQLPISDKGLRKLSEGFRHYKHALCDEEVAAAITAIVQRAKKGSARAELKVRRACWPLRVLVQEARPRPGWWCFQGGAAPACSSHGRPGGSWRCLHLPTHPPTHSFPRSRPQAEIEAFEQKIAEYAQERADEERTAEEARRHAEERAGGASQARSGDDVSAMRRQLGGMGLEEGQASGQGEGGAAAAEAEAMSEDGGDSGGEEEGQAAAAAVQPAVSEQLSGTAVKARREPEAVDQQEALAKEEEAEEEAPRQRRGRRAAAAAAAADAPAAAQPAARRGGRRRAAVVDEEEAQEQQAGEEEAQEQSPAAANRGGRGASRARGGKVAALAAKFGGGAEEPAPAKATRRSTRGRCALLGPAHMAELCSVGCALLEAGWVPASPCPTLCCAHLPATPLPTTCCRSAQEAVQVKEEPTE